MRSVQSRREALHGAAALAAILLLPKPVDAAPADMQAAIVRVTGGAKLNAGRVRLEVPPLSENGNTVPITVTVESPMTPADHVRAIHVFNEKNPQPYVITARLGPRAGEANLQTRIRLSDTQTIIAIAELSDGTFWAASAHVIVTLGACLEELI
jgi:sulfur-oxidizing protein SoxY